MLSSEVDSPMIVGVLRPVVLLPDAFFSLQESELRAALCHEFAHIRRRDPLVNLICYMGALPVSWHPVMKGVQRRIRQTREMVCDAMAAETMRSPVRYARSLLTMARWMMADREGVNTAQAIGLFEKGLLEERVIQLTKGRSTMSIQAKAVRLAGGVAVATAVVCGAAMFHVRPTMAESRSVEIASVGQNAPVMSGDAAASLPVLATPTEPLAPVAPLQQEVAAPVAPAEPVAPIEPVKPMAPVSPTPALDPAPTPSTQERVHRWEGGKGKSYTIVNGKVRELTPEEKANVDKAVAEANEAAAKAKAYVNSPEFKKEIEDAKRQAAEARAFTQSDDFKRQIENARREAEKARELVNSPEFKRQMEDVKRQAAEARAFTQSDAFKKQMEDSKIQAEATRRFFNSDAFKKQFEDTQRQALEASKKAFEISGQNNQEFQQHMEALRHQTEEMREHIQHQMDEMRQSMQENKLDRQKEDAPKQ